jgi:hypothetical protein
MKTQIHLLIILLALSTIASVSGCSKKDTTTPSACSNGIKDADETGVDCGGSCNACIAVQAKIKTYVSTTSVNPFYDSLAYDNSGRQVTRTGDRRRYDFIYSADSVLKNYFEFSSGSSGTISYVLNSEGLAVSAIDRNDGGIIVHYTYSYDAQGYLIKETSFDEGGFFTDTTINTWLEGNLLSSFHSRYNQNPGLLLSENTTYTYYADKANSIGDENQGIFFLGKSSKNLLKASNSGSGEFIYTYTYDASGRVASEGGYLYYTYY